MNIIEINTDTCNRDGICAACCPPGIIEFSKGEYPSLVEGAEEICIRCGHCVAICPTGSITHREMPVEECPPINKELLLSPEQCEHFFRSRRSIRAYKEKAVDADTIERLIEIARFAPSGHNSQCVEWTVLGGRDELRNLAGIVIDWMRHTIDTMPELASGLHMDRTVSRWEAGSDVIFRGAPMVILAHAPREIGTAPAASMIALTYLELAATTLGLGGCWAGYFMAASGLYQPMKDALPIPDGHLSHGAMMIGYPRFNYHRLPTRKPPRIHWKI